jgi:CheY-like chemotaxis protein
MHILIVDDDDDIRGLLGLILSAQGHSVDEAADGQHALSRLRSGDGRRPSIILLDLMMPRLDGEGFIREARQDPRLMEIPVWIISGHPAAQQRAMRLGATGCLVKPIDLDQLLSVVESAAPPDARALSGHTL